MSTMKLSFYGGVGEIGGNMILLEAAGARVFLDFGMSYSRQELFFEFPLLRPGCADDLFKTGILPRLCGLYKNAGLKPSYLPDGTPTVCGEEEDCSVDAVLLSHAHMDHYGYLGMLRPDIPVYLSPISKRLIELRNDIREDWQTKVDLEALLPIGNRQNFDIGNLQIQRLDVDHSILGASAYLIRLGDEVVAYTGDFRFHGSFPEDTQKFMRICQEVGVDYLICEGTRIGPPPEGEEEVESHALASEREVAQKCRDILSRENGLVIYDASPADMNRMRLICHVAEECGRIPVFDSKKAYLLLYLNHPKQHFDGLPAVGQFKVVLSRMKLRSDRYEKYGLPEDLYAEAFTDYRQSHEAKLLVAQRGKPIGGKQIEELLKLADDTFVWGPLRENILREPERYLIYTSSGPHTLLHFFPQDGRKMPGTYIYGKAEPFSEEVEFSFNRLLNWIRLCGLRLEYAHTSGHLHQQDLERFIGELDPKVVVPIHTEHPELFRQWARDVRIPCLGQTMEC